MPEFENYIPIAEVAGMLPGRPSLSTVTRWSTRGVRGVRLPTICVGRRRFVHRDEIAKFVERMSMEPCHA